MNSIEVRGLCKDLGRFKLRDVSFDLPKGTIMGIIGQNGAGKSTTFKLILNALTRDEGSVKVLGEDCQGEGFVGVKNQIGVVLDEASFPEVLTAQNINVFMKRIYEKWDEERFFAYLDRWNVPRNQRFKEFSKGMKMKLQIAVCLSHNAKLLVLDEATSGLDPVFRDEVLNELNEFTRNEENSILMSSHITSDLEKICDYIGFINDGKMVILDEKDALMERYGVVKVSKEDFEAIGEDAIVGKRETSFGYEVLVYRDRVNSAFRMEHSTLEDIVLFFVRGA